jgi:DNA polymerase-3 subunit gamma/tau
VADQPKSPSPASDTAEAASYHSLYRRFRPQRFADVRGQDHVTRALRNAVREGRVNHAYLFSGPRGTGKTSTARILAMALNCANPVDGEPDGVCESCVEIRRGASVDVQELDAASNRRLDEMRELLARVPLGTRGRWKVYIIDEVHQLTPDASSALLKTLEEPPGHVVFVLATTDPQKVLPTIRSRTIHFEFHLLPSDVLGELLTEVNERAGLGLDREAIDVVVRRGHGSARDALTVLDQVAGAGDVDDEAEVVADVVDGLAAREVSRVLLAIAKGMASGRDARRLAADILDHLRDGFLATMAPGLVMLPEAALARVEEQAHQLGPAALVRAMEGIGAALAEMRDSVDPRVTLEVALVRLARPESDVSPAALLERIERLERLRSRGGQSGGPDAGPPAAVPSAFSRTAPSSGVQAPGATSPAGADRPADLPRDPTVAKPALGAMRAANRPATASRPPPGPVTPARAAMSTTPVSRPAVLDLPSRDELTKAWGDDVLRSLSGRAKAYLGSGRFVAVDPDGAVYALPDRHLLARSQDVRAEAEAGLAARFGREVPLKLVTDGDAGSGAAPRAAADPTPPVEATEPYEVGDLEDAGPAVTSPAQRLLEAFPGAEEVSP